MNDSPCDCMSWACTDMRQMMLGNGHNPACKHFVPTVGAVDLLERLVKGIETWGSYEDGIPDEVWFPYTQAVFITRGETLEEQPQ